MKPQQVDYPILAPNSRAFGAALAKKILTDQRSPLVDRRVTSYGNFRFRAVDASTSCEHIGATSGVNSRQVLGGWEMGAAPERKERQVVVSPLRVTQSQVNLAVATTVGPNPGPQRFARVPTHAIGVAQERRRNPRAYLALPLRLTRVGDKVEPIPVTLVTRNISSSGVYFLAPRKFEPGTAIELEVALVERPLGQGSVQMCTAAHIVRAEDSDMPGWRGYAASFDDFALRRDDDLPLRYRTP